MRKYDYEKSIQKYCEDISKIENYELAKADNFEGWNCHHKLELKSTGGVCDVTAQDLIDWGLYYNRPADELIFLTRGEHSSIHNKAKRYSSEAKKKISEAHKGKPSWSKGLHMTDEWKKLHPTFGHTKSCLGQHWYTNGIISIMAFECPEGFKKGRHSRTK